MSPVLSCFPLVKSRQADGSYDPSRWARQVRSFRIVPLLAVATWWSFCETFPQANLLTTLSYVFPRLISFCIAPSLSIAIARMIVYLSSREILSRRWTNTDILRLTTWSTIGQTVPLLMVAISIDFLRQHAFVGLIWLTSAAPVALIATLRLRAAEGFKPHNVHSGELHKRAFVIAKRMGVRLRDVYVVPSGRGRITNAFGGIPRSIGVSDDYGKWLKGSQLDFVVGHELAHIKQNHVLKELALLPFLFCVIAGLGVALPRVPAVRSVLPFVAVFAPLLVFYFVSRRFEYAADRIGVEIAGDVKAAVEALKSLHRHTQQADEFSRIAELFSTHPALSQRVNAIIALHPMDIRKASQSYQPVL